MVRVPKIISHGEGVLDIPSENSTSNPIYPLAQKKKWIAYALHLLGGGGYLGLHRFYLGFYQSAKIQLALTVMTFFSFGFFDIPRKLEVVLMTPVIIWYIADLFLIPKMVRERNAAILNTTSWGRGAA